MSNDDRVFAWSRGHGEFDLGGCSREFRKKGLDEAAVGMCKHIRFNLCSMPLGMTYFMPLELPAQSQ